MTCNGKTHYVAVGGEVIVEHQVSSDDGATKRTRAVIQFDVGLKFEFATEHIGRCQRDDQCRP